MANVYSHSKLVVKTQTRTQASAQVQLNPESSNNLNASQVPMWTQSPTGSANAAPLNTPAASPSACMPLCDAFSQDEPGLPGLWSAPRRSRRLSVKHGAVSKVRAPSRPTSPDSFARLLSSKLQSLSGEPQMQQDDSASGAAPDSLSQALDKLQLNFENSATPVHRCMLRLRSIAQAAENQQQAASVCHMCRAYVLHYPFA